MGVNVKGLLGLSVRKNKRELKYQVQTSVSMAYMVTKVYLH